MYKLQQVLVAINSTMSSSPKHYIHIKEHMNHDMLNIKKLKSQNNNKKLSYRRETALQPV